MANVSAAHLIGESLTYYLTHSYPKSLSDQFKCEFKQMIPGELPDKTPATSTAGLILYRVSWNEHLRQARSPSTKARMPLALNLHYLLTIWGKSVEEEHILFTWTLLQLHLVPVMDRSLLRGNGGWRATDQVEWIPENFTQEQMARIWDKWNVPFRLSAGYMARVVQIEPSIEQYEYLPVVARRDIYRGPLEEAER